VIVLKNKKRALKIKETSDSFIDFLPEMFILIDASDWTVLQLNEAMAKSLGKTKKELIGKNILELFPPNVAKIRKEQAKKVILTGKSVYFEDQRDGRWFENVFHPVFDSKGKVTKGAVVVHEITNRKKVEEALEESENKFKVISDQSLMGIGIFQDNKIKYINNAMQSIIGYSKEEVKQDGINILSKIISPEYLSFVSEQLRKKQLGNKDVINRYPVKIITKSGKSKWIEVFSKTIIYEGKTADFITYVDITKSKEAQDQVKRTKEYLQNLINSATEIILVVDKNLKITTWNKTAENITGYKSKEVIGKSLKILDLFENINIIIDFLKDTKRKIPFNELILTTKSGSKKILKVNFSHLESDSKLKENVLIMGDDITKESEIHGKIMFGNSYFIINKTNDFSIHLFKDFIVSGYNGMLITRDIQQSINNNIHNLYDIKMLLLSQEKISKYENVFELDEIVAKIDKFTKTKSQSIILLDRIDYLITNFSFDACMKSIYKITNIISRNKGIFFLRLNPSVINDSQLALIKEELKQIPGQRISDIQLEEYIYDILLFINIQNQKNTIITYKSISRNFSISKVTTAKRLNILKEKGLILIKKHGKTKTIRISEKGMTLLKSRQII
jgi:PAS domain S-box-containing protein